MRSRFLLFGFACVSLVFLVRPATSQDSAQPGDLSIPVEELIAAPNEFGLPSDDVDDVVKKIREIERQAKALQSPTLNTNDDALLLSLLRNGDARSVAVAEENSSDLFITPELLEALGRPNRSEVRLSTPTNLAEVFANSLRSRIGQAGVEIQRSIDITDITGIEIPQNLVNHRNRLSLPSSVGQATYDCINSQRKFRSEIEEQLFGSGFSVSRTKDETEKIVLSTKAFDKDCLETVSATQVGPDGLPLKFVAVLLDPEDGAFCMAANLGAGRFLTAKHCRFRKTESGAYVERTRVLVSLADRSALKLRAVFLGRAEPSFQYADQDFTEFTVPALSDAERFDNLRVQDPDHFLRLNLVGYFALSDISSSLASGMAPVWVQSLRTTRKLDIPYCQVVDFTSANEVGGGCIQHGCQAFPSYSGSPMFTKAGNDWHLVGIHIGLNDGSNSCSSEYSAGGLLKEKGNIGARIPNSVREYLNS